MKAEIKLIMENTTSLIACLLTLLSCQNKMNKPTEHLVVNSKSSIVFSLVNDMNRDMWINVKSAYSIDPVVFRLDKTHKIDSVTNVTGNIVFYFGDLYSSTFYEYHASSGDTIEIKNDSKGYPFIAIRGVSKQKEPLQNIYYYINKSNVGINSLVLNDLNNLRRKEKKEFINPEKALSTNLKFVDSLFKRKMISEEEKCFFELRQYGFLSSYYLFRNNLLAFKTVFEEKLLPQAHLIDTEHYFKDLFITYVKDLAGVDLDNNEIDYAKLANKNYSRFSNASTDYLFYYLVNKAKIYQPKKYQEIKQLFLRNCKDDGLIRYFLESEIPEVSRINSSKDVLLGTRTKEIVFDDLLAKFKGKVIYLDFWASWCAPCIAEMPKSKALREKYAKKDVVFLFLSIDNNLKDWLNSQHRLNMNDTTFSYLFADPKNSQILKLLDLKSIPRYLIYDKKGKLINADAPGPSKLLESDMLDQLL